MRKWFSTCSVYLAAHFIFFFILGEIIRLSHFNISTQTNALHIFFGIRVPIIEIAYSRSVSTVSCREIPYEKYGSCLRKKKRTGKALSAFWEDVCIENFFFSLNGYSLQGTGKSVYLAQSF